MSFSKLRDAAAAAAAKLVVQAEVLADKAGQQAERCAQSEPAQAWLQKAQTLGGAVANSAETWAQQAKAKAEEVLASEKAQELKTKVEQEAQTVIERLPEEAKAKVAELTQLGAAKAQEVKAALDTQTDGLGNALSAELRKLEEAKTEGLLGNTKVGTDGVENLARNIGYELGAVARVFDKTLQEERKRNSGPKA